MTSERNYCLDNFKAILMFTVVLGHLYELIIFPTSRFQYLIIYSFHMPAFAFISGLCFKRTDDNKLFKNVLYPYIIFQTFYTLLLFFKDSPESNLTLQYYTPYWALWYLLALFLWCALANIISDSKKSGAIILILTFIIAILVGYDNKIGYYLSLSRTVVYFPMFFAGVYISSCAPNLITKLKNIKSLRFISVGLILISVFFLYLYRNSITPSWFYNSSAYSVNGCGLLFRIINYLLAIVFILFFILFLPNKRIPFITYIGQNTVSVFVLHIFIIRFLPTKLLLEWLPVPAVSVVLLALIITAVLSSRPVNALFSPLLHWPFGRKKHV